MDKLWEQLCKKYNYDPTPDPKIYRDGMSFHSLQLEPGITWDGDNSDNRGYLQNHMTSNLIKIKAIIFGPGRTGSAILTNICFYLFGPEHVYPTHRNKFIAAKNQLKAPLLLSIRDFRNSMVSHWRCDKGITSEMMDDGKQMTKEDLKNYLNSKSKMGNKNFILRLEYVQEFILNHDYDCGIDYQPIYYEKVLGNIPALLRIIEIYFKIQIPDIYKEYLDKKYNVKNRSKYFTGERNTEENTYNLGITDWRNHIPENLYDYVYEKLEPHLKLWGYDHEDKLADGGFSIPVSFRSNYLGEEVHKMAIRETKQKKG